MRCTIIQGILCILLLLTLSIPANASAKKGSDVPDKQPVGLPTEIDLAEIGVIESLLENRQTTEFAHIEARRLIERFTQSRSYGALGHLYLALGDSVLITAHEKKFLKIRNMSYRYSLKSAMEYYDNALSNFEKMAPFSPYDFYVAFSKNFEMRAKEDGLLRAARWGLSKIDNSKLSKPEEKVFLLSKLLGLIESHEKGAADRGYLVVKYHTLLHLKELSVGNPDREFLRGINARIGSVNSNPEFEKLVQTLNESEKIPNQSILLELMMVFAIWGLAIATIYVMSARLKAGSLRHNCYNLWPDNNNIFSVSKYDRLSKYFILNNNIPTLMVFAMVFVLGFCLLSALNYIEGTLWNTPLFRWTYLRCFSDPINWGIVAPIFFVVLRYYYEYIPFCLNAFYENLLPDDEQTREKFLSALNNWSYFINFPWRNSVILMMAFAGASAGYLSLGQSVEFYGMDTISGSYGFLTNFLIRYPTVTGWYVITILTILVYAIINAAWSTLTVIIMFRVLYRNFSDMIIPHPFHIDKHGGMAFSGRLAIKMMMVISCAALMGADLVLRDFFIIGKPIQLYHYLMLPLYLFVAPLPFIIPIMDARRVLLQMRNKVMNALLVASKTARDEFFCDTSLHISPGTSGEFAKDFSLIMEKGNRLLTLDCPVWPISFHQLNGFVTVFFIPVVVPAALQKILG